MREMLEEENAMERECDVHRVVGVVGVVIDSI